MTIKSKLAGWKMNMLSKARRTTLAKIDKLTRTFLWGSPYIHWVKWDTVIWPKNRGGLGIQTARDMNVTLLGKHLCTLLHEPNKLWVNIVSAECLRLLFPAPPKWNSQGALSQLVDYVHISDTNLMLKDIIYDGFIHWNMLPTPIP
ncbi:putative ribonuclease H protein [Glycine soja]